MAEEAEVIVPEVEQAKTDEQAPTTENVVETETAPETQPEKTFTQAQLDEIVQKRLDKERRKQERQRYKAEGRAEALQEQQQAQKSDDKPKLENFANDTDFIEALADWKVGQKLANIEKEREAKTVEEKQKIEQERVSELNEELLERAEAKYEDFDEVVNKSNFSISQAAYLAVLESPISEDIVYHLAKDPEAAKAFNELSPYAQAKAIGTIETTLTAKAPVKTSNAPEPIKPVGGAKATNETGYRPDMSDKEFAAWRKRQMAQRR